MDDKRTRQLVEEELAWTPDVDAADIGVTVEQGVVRLYGHVGTLAQKHAAEMAAKRVKGVRALVDDVELRPFAAAYTDEAIAGIVANVLEWAASVPHGSVVAQVEAGFVTLTGEVDWQYQRLAAEQAVRPIRGVRGVNNHIQVRPHVPAKDIQRSIEGALARLADLGAHQVKVAVDGDHVRLEGKVRSWTERRARPAQTRPPVRPRAVEDRLTVEP